MLQQGWVIWDGPHRKRYIPKIYKRKEEAERELREMLDGRDTFYRQRLSVALFRNGRRVRPPPGECTSILRLCEARKEKATKPPRLSIALSLEGAGDWWANPDFSRTVCEHVQDTCFSPDNKREGSLWLASPNFCR